MRITFDCVLNSYGFGIRCSEIACDLRFAICDLRFTIYDLRFANELEMGLYGLPSANEFPNIAKDELEMMTQKVTKAQKYVGGHKSAAKSTEKRDKLDGDLAKLK